MPIFLTTARSVGLMTVKVVENTICIAVVEIWLHIPICRTSAIFGFRLVKCFTCHDQSTIKILQVQKHNGTGDAFQFLACVIPVWEHSYVALIPPKYCGRVL